MMEPTNNDLSYESATCEKSSKEEIKKVLSRGEEKEKPNDNAESQVSKVTANVGLFSKIGSFLTGKSDDSKTEKVEYEKSEFKEEKSENKDLKLEITEKTLIENEKSDASSIPQFKEEMLEKSSVEEKLENFSIEEKLEKSSNEDNFEKSSNEKQNTISSDEESKASSKEEKSASSIDEIPLTSSIEEKPVTTLIKEEFKTSEEKQEIVDKENLNASEQAFSSSPHVELSEANRSGEIKLGETHPISNLDGTSPSETRPISNLDGTSPSETRPISNLDGTSPSETHPISNLDGTSPSETRPISNLDGTSPSETSSNLEGNLNEKSDNSSINEANNLEKISYEESLATEIVESKSEDENDFEKYTKQEANGVNEDADTFENHALSSENGTDGEEYPQNDSTKEVQSVDTSNNSSTAKEGLSMEDSEYDTPEQEEEDGDRAVRSKRADSESEDDSDENTEALAERQEADGQEADRQAKKLDHDEDKRDPQYIPKKGNFYEHDDRTSETEETPVKKPVPVMKSEKESRWKHDLYDEDLQGPKSPEELIDLYGYDIRREEGPPKARRRRRYGRGPNKYTRHWEEEEAYTKGKGQWRGPRGGRTPPRRNNDEFPPRKIVEDFPPLPTKDLHKEKEDEPERADKDEKPPVQNGTQMVHNSAQKRLEVRRVEVVNEKQSARQEEKPKQPELRQEAKTPPAQRKTIKQALQAHAAEPQPMIVRSTEWGPAPPLTAQVVPDGAPRGRGRGRNPPGSGHGPRPSVQNRLQQFQRREQSHGKPSTAEEDIATLSQHFSEAVINVDNKPLAAATTRANSLPPSTNQPSPQYKPQPPKQSQPSEKPPRQPSEKPPSQPHHEKESKSKRYSMQRQRSLPQGTVPPTVPPPVQPPQHFIQEQFYQHGPPPPMDTPTAPAPQSVPPPQFTPSQPPPYPPPPDVQMMAFIPPPPPAGQFPPMYCAPPPPAYLPVQVSQIPQAPPPRPDVYQGAGGITYYNTQTQVSRPTPTRRVKLAIPIVPPPEKS